MSNTQEPELTPNVEGLEADSRFVPRWTGCTGLFNEADGVNRRENEEVHYRKHAVIGREWETHISISEY